MRLLARFGVLAILPLLGGCFDLRQDLSVAADGTATMVAQFSLSAEMIGMALEEGDDEDFCPADAADVPPPFTAKNELSTTENGDTVCTITVVGPIDQLQTILNEDAFNPGGIEGDDGTITITAEGGGVYAYALTFAVPADDPPAANATPEEANMQAAMEQMILEAMAGRFLTWSVTAPRIISTDGTLEGNTATLQVPVTALINEQGAQYSLNVRFALQ